MHPIDLTIVTVYLILMAWSAVVGNEGLSQRGILLSGWKESALVLIAWLTDRAASISREPCGS